MQSKGFGEAPDAVLRALYRLIWAKQAVISAAKKYINLLDQERFVGEHTNIPDSNNFNELLALGYMESDSINVSLILTCSPDTWPFPYPLFFTVP